MKVASWNVNSIRVRIKALVEWLGNEAPDVCCLQETKVVDDDFPFAEIAAAGYHAVTSSQKTYNGVAVLVPRAAADSLACVSRDLPGEPEDGQRRFLHVRLPDLDVIDVYVPNGESVGSEKYAYKLRWMERLRAYLASSCDPASRLLLCGDFNVAPEDRDVYDPRAVAGSVMWSAAEKEALAAIRAWGLADTLRLKSDAAGIYSWWDYRQGAFRRNMGWRIDFVLATAPMAARVESAGVDVWPRKMPQASDHAPIFTVFA